jgi:hypothetical protein
MTMTDPTRCDDSDWLRDDPLPPPASTRPTAFRGCWRCDELAAEPVRHATLLEATCEPPRSPDAEVYGSGDLLATSADDIAAWRFTPAGYARIARENRESLARDYDAMLNIVLADDLRRIA